MKKYLAIFTAVLLTVHVLPVSAKGHPEHQGKPPSFEEMDANGDGELSEDELEGRLKEDFDELDSDGSGTLTSDEIPSGPPPRN